VDWNDLDENQLIDAIQTGRLNPQVILLGYVSGIFPMGDPHTGRIDWYSPNPRAIIELNKFHIPGTLRPILRSGRFRVTVDQAFEKVIRACSERDSTWITSRIIDCYCSLFKEGFGHSVEVWFGTELAGGLYGVAIGGAFFGESMFHTKTNASKVALAALVRQLTEQKFDLLDIQYLTSHLIRFGATTIPRDQYLHRLGRAISKNRIFVRPGQQTIEFQ